MRVRQKVLVELSAQTLSPLAEIEPGLVLAFGALRFFEDPAFAPLLAELFPSAVRVGCSTAGEICGRTVSSNSLVVTAVAFGNARAVAGSTLLDGAQDSRAAGRRLAEAIATPSLAGAVVLGQGVGINGSALIAGMTDRLGPGFPLFGGLAGDDGAFRRTFVMDGDRVSDRALVAVGLLGEELVLSRGSVGGWKSFGPVRRATRAEGNVLHELDAQPALGVWKRYLGSYAKELPASGLLFPFALLNEDRSDAGLIRTPLAVDEEAGTITLAGDVPEGAWLRLMHASTDALVDGAEAAARLACGPAIEGGGEAREGEESLALLVSCIGRKLVMGDAVDEEVEAVGEVLGPGCALAGFYSNGEIGPYGTTGECRLHNQTMSILRISER